jgi:adenine phosphoribosyltransferase
VLRDVYTNAGVVNSGSYLTTVNELCDQVPALRPDLLRYVVSQMRQLIDLSSCTKLLSEEEKGAPIATAMSLATDLPLAMARHYPYALPTAPVGFSSEYTAGSLYVNGIEPGDVVCIVDDTLSTGGTIAALIDTVIARGATVSSVVVAVEKSENGGRRMLAEKYDVQIVSLIQIAVTGAGVAILSGVE